jgi:hypothetical protein
MTVVAGRCTDLPQVAVDINVFWDETAKEPRRCPATEAAGSLGQGLRFDPTCRHTSAFAKAIAREAAWRPFRHDSEAILFNTKSPGFAQSRPLPIMDAPNLLTCHR